MKACYSTQQSHGQRSKDPGTGLSPHTGALVLLFLMLYLQRPPENSSGLQPNASKADGEWGKRETCLK